MSMLPSTHQNKLKKLAGYIRFAPKNADGTYQAAIIASPSAEFGISVEATTSTYVGREEGAGQVLSRDVDQVDRAGTIASNQFTDDMQALFVMADVTAIAQASGTVTGEISAYVVPGRSIQLGGDTNNSTGIFQVSAVTIESYEGANAATAATSTAYVVGAVVVPATPNDHWYMATAITTGTSAGTAPTWPTSGGTVVDGGVTWTDMGLIAYTAGTDYELDTTYGLVNLPTTGAIATAFGKVPASIRAAGKGFRLEVAYTRAAASFNQIASHSRGAVEGKFWFHERNAKGENGVWYAPQASLTPNGELSLKSGEEYGVMGFDVAFLAPPVGSALYRNGIPQ